MRVKLLFFLFMCLFQSIWAQQSKVDELKAQIRAYKECIIKLSMPEYHSKEYTLENGKHITVSEQSDFNRNAFTSIDPTLEDPKQWIESLYFYKKEQGKSKTLIDTKGLSSWELESIRQISNDYFNSGDNVFHIAAHGLVDSRGVSANAIQMDGKYLDAKETADLILRSMADVNHMLLNVDEQPFVIVLHSCNSAQGENSFAKQLSIELAKKIDNVAVVGAPDAVYCEMDEKGNYTEMVSSVNAVKRNQPERKNWLVFQNGKQTMQGTPDYKSTVQKYLGK